uniref:Uncharacterized protein n=1 Tax=Acrobeloides nanus TaxID=290746 RepID=A0A914C7U0_9BILA
MEKHEPSKHTDTTDQVQTIGIKFEPKVQERVYKYHIYEWQYKSKKSCNGKSQSPKLSHEGSLEKQISEEKENGANVAKLPSQNNSFDEALYKTVNCQYT